MTKDELRARIARWRAERNLSPRREVRPKPRYDEVFFRGVEWLDSLAGDSEDEAPDCDVMNREKTHDW